MAILCMHSNIIIFINRLSIINFLIYYTPFFRFVNIRLHNFYVLLRKQRNNQLAAFGNGAFCVYSAYSWWDFASGGTVLFPFYLKRETKHDILYDKTYAIVFWFISDAGSLTKCAEKVGTNMP